MEFSLQSASRNPCFVEEEDGLVPIPGVDGEIPGNNVFRIRSNSLRNLGNFNSVSSPRSVGYSGRFHDSRFGRSNLRQQSHFLDSCHLCNKPLGGNGDIFMYRGDTPFCSEECRQEQIEKDEATEKKQSLSSSMKVMRRKEQRRSSSPTKSSQGYTPTTGTVGAA